LVYIIGQGKEKKETQPHNQNIRQEWINPADSVSLSGSVCFYSYRSNKTKKRKGKFSPPVIFVSQ